MKSNKNTPKINEKAFIITIVAIILLIAIGISTFFIFDYIFIDTPYDGINIPKRVKVAKYIGAELSAAEVEDELKETKAGIIKLFTKKEKVTSGKIEEGMNVTVSITASVTEGSYTSYEIADIGNHQAEEGKQAFFDALQEHILTKVSKIDFESGTYENKAPTFTYTYPSNYNVDALKGKEVTHEIFITSVSVTNAPEFTDELLKNNPDEIIEFLGLHVTFESVAEFEDYMRHQIELNTLWNSIVDGSKVTKKGYPEKHIKKYEDEYDAYYERVMQQNQISSWTALYKELGTNESGYIAKRLEYANGVVLEEMILYHIIQEQGIRMSGKEYKKNGATIAVENGYDDLDDYEDTLGKEMAKRTVHWEMVKEYLLSKAKRVA